MQEKPIKILLTTFFVHFQELSVFYDHLYRWLIQNLPENKIDVKFLMNEEDYNENLRSHFLDILNPVLLNKNQVDYIFEDSPNYDFYSLFNKVNFEKLSDVETERLKEVSTSILKDWEPDIVIYQSFFNTKNIWGKIYPNALFLTTDNGIFARSPFYRAVVYDPINTTPYNFMTQFENEIKNFKISLKQKYKINILKKAITRLINKHSTIKKEMKELKKQYKKTILLPLSGNLSNTLFKDCIRKTDNEIIEYVMQKTPSDVGVFITQGDVRYSLEDKDIEYFSDKYKNFIFLRKTDEHTYSSNSLYYYQYIDACFNTLSKTALTASLLYDKPVISLNENFNNIIADYTDIKDIKKALTKRAKKKDNILYWYLTRYILYEQSFGQDNFLYNYLIELLNSYRRKGITFDFYKQNYSLNDIYGYIIEPIKEYYGYKTKYKMIYDKISIQLQSLCNITKDRYHQIATKLNIIKDKIMYFISSLIKTTKYYKITKR